MGIYILSYGVELPALKRAFSSKNEVLLQAVCATETFAGYAAQDFPGAVPTAEALRQIIYGEPYDYQSAHSYGYALICLCDYVGVDLTGDSDFKLGYVTDLVDKYLASDFAVDDVDCAIDLFAETPDLNLPPIDDFPGIGILLAAEIQSLYSQLSPIVITDARIDELLSGDLEDEKRGHAYEAIKAFKARIDYCHQHQLALLSFCH